MIECPFCEQEIDPGREVCPHCKKDLRYPWYVRDFIIGSGSVATGALLLFTPLSPPLITIVGLFAGPLVRGGINERLKSIRAYELREQAKGKQIGDLTIGEILIAFVGLDPNEKIDEDELERRKAIVNQYLPPRLPGILWMLFLSIFASLFWILLLAIGIYISSAIKVPIISTALFWFTLGGIIGWVNYGIVRKFLPIISLLRR